MIFTRSDRDVAEKLFACVAARTAAAGGGVNRPSYGRGETIAWEIVAATATDLGLHARSDAAGNLVVLRDEAGEQLT